MMNHYEDNDQAAVFRWAAYNRGKYLELDLMYHIPNGGKRNRLEAARLKAQGVKAGVPDICLPVPRNGWHGLYIELKHGKNRATDLQKWWISKLREQGYFAIVCYGWEETTKAIEQYLKGECM